MGGYGGHVLEGAFAAAETRGCHDGVAGFEAGDVFADDFNDTCGFDAEYFGPGLDHHFVMESLPVERVEGYGAVADADLVGAGDGIGSLDELKGAAFLG